MSEMHQIFDRELLRIRRNRAARTFVSYNFLIKEVGERLADRLLDIKRDFPIALNLGARMGGYGPYPNGPGGVKYAVASEISEGFVGSNDIPSIVADSELQPFARSAFDLVYSNLDLHWVNDLPGSLLQIKRCLKPDGLFLGAIFGGRTLYELRDVLTEAEFEVTGGVSPRVSPFTELKDAGALLQRAGFSLPVADVDEIIVTYDNLFKLANDLRGMAEANVLNDRIRKPTKRTIFLRAAEIYAERYCEPPTRIRGTFQIIYLHGWAAHDSQPRALRPGSASNRIADALESQEIPLQDFSGLPKNS